jgi:hypothetical protein
MPAKYVTLYWKSFDAYELEIKLRRLKGVFHIYFLHCSAEYDFAPEPEGDFLSPRQRIIYLDEFKDGTGFWEVIATAEEVDDFYHLGSYLPQISELVSEMKEYKFLRVLARQIIEDPRYSTSAKGEGLAV